MDSNSHAFVSAETSSIVSLNILWLCIYIIIINYIYECNIYEYLTRVQNIVCQCLIKQVKHAQKNSVVVNGEIDSLLLGVVTPNNEIFASYIFSFIDFNVIAI